MDKHIIVVAGGSGKRMDQSLPKQFLELSGKPIITHTLDRIMAADGSTKVTLVMHPDWIDHWRNLAGEYADIPVTPGGVRRWESVARGLDTLADATGLIGVHDAVRPLVSAEVINDCFAAAEEHGAAVPVVPLNESLREMSGAASASVDRMNYRIVQTPQCFRAEVILQAYKLSYEDRFTDDATVVEANGQEIYLVNGNVENIKVTTPSDMLIAESFISKI